MKYLLDTDVVIDYLKNQPAATQLLNPLLPQGAAISVLTYSEIWEGVLSGPNAQQHRRGFLLVTVHATSASGVAGSREGIG